MLLRLFFGGLYLNKGVLARFRHGLLHLNCSWHWWWLLNPKATTGPGLGNAAMTDQKPKHMFFGNSPLNTVAIVIFFGVGYGLIKKFWPDSDVALWILIALGMAGYSVMLWRQRDRS